MQQIKLTIAICILLTMLSCGLSQQPYTPPVPPGYIPRLEVPFGDTGKKIEGELNSGPKQYVVRVPMGERLNLMLEPGQRSVLLSVTDMQTGEVLTRDVVGMSQQAPSTGDYLISVYGSGPFSLTCRITSP